MEVKVIEVDSEGKVRLSRKELLPRPEGLPDRPQGDRDRDRRRGPRPRGGGGDRRR